MAEIKLCDKNIIDIDEDKFIQRMTITKKIEQCVCHWIMSEFKKYTKHTNEWSNNIYMSDDIYKSEIFFLEKIPSIFPYILELFGSIVDDIKRCYYLNHDYIYEIREIFIEKYIYNNSQFTYNYTQDTIVINILLNKNKNKHKDFIYFSDDIISRMDIGDMIIFSTNTHHRKMNDHNDEMYVLVGLITIYTNDIVH